MAMLFCAITSLLVAGFAIAVIAHEFRGRWDQIVAAMMFEEAETASRPINPQLVRQALPVVARSKAAQRLPLRHVAA